MRVSKIIGKSFELWIANPIIIVPFLLQFFSSIIFTFLFTKFFFQPKWESLETLGFWEAIFRDLITKILESYYSLALFIVLAALAVFISCFLLSGSIGIANEISKGKKAKFHDILEYGRRFWFLYLITSILVGLTMLFGIIIGASLFLAVSMLGFSEITINIITVVFAILVILLAIIFVPTTSLLIVENIKPVNAIKISFRLSKRNYLSLLLLILLLVMINVFTNLIPYIGEIIGFLILNPIQTIAIVIFIIDRLPSLKQSPKQKKK